MMKTHNRTLKVAILGSGNIGTDLMIKIMQQAQHLKMAAMAGIDPKSQGLARAKKSGVTICDNGLEGLSHMPIWKQIELVFDATSAASHQAHHDLCMRDGKQIIDLTPAAIGPYCVPVVNMEAHLQAPNVNMVSCGGQATIPIVHAVRRVSKSVPYAEIVASISSRSAGPGTRANIDEFTVTTARGIEQVGGAGKGKAIIVLNPAEPPLLMRDTIYAFSVEGQESDIARSIENMVMDIQTYVPGYRLKQAVQFERYGANHPLRFVDNQSGQIQNYQGVKVSVFVEVEGAAHYLPAYAGNLDIMTAAALATGEKIAALKIGV